MLSCKEVVKDLSSETHQSFFRRMEIQLHLLLCRHCGKYARQLQMLKTAFGGLLKQQKQSADPQRVKELEARILKNLPKE